MRLVWQIQEKGRDMLGLAKQSGEYGHRGTNKHGSQSLCRGPIIEGTPPIIGSLPAKTGLVLDATIQEESN